MQEVLLIKNGEIILKGLNRPVFESLLVRNIRRRLEGLGPYTVERSQSTITVAPENDGFGFEEAAQRIGRVFGIASFSRALVLPKEMEAIRRGAAPYLEKALAGAKTFKVEAKRSDKKFPLTSPEIAADLGAALLDAFPHLSVDVHRPDVTVYCEIRDTSAFLHAGSIQGAGGMPIGSNGRAALLISGGIDSPVAGWMMAKRGVELCAVHFASPPYTSERAREKVLELLRLVGRYSGRIACFVVPFAEIQLAISEHCPEEFYTLIMRRHMMRLAGRVALAQHCGALVTGESIGQVASQTMEALACTEAASELPIFRPLIGMDKEEIVAVARKIGTFETSILPYEDCCTLFTPKHPRTRPKLHYVEEAEARLNFGPLLDQAFENTEKIVL